jgi:hypothetical protein
MQVTAILASDNIIDVNAGSSYSTVLGSNGEVMTWGYNFNGQLADGTKVDKKLPVKAKNITNTGNLTNVSKIDVSDGHTIALLTDGSLVGWGRNLQGQIGDGTKTERSLPVVIAGLTGITKISARTGHSVALDSTGKTWSWGLNVNGQLGLGNSGLGTERTVPTQMTAISNIRDVVTGGSMTTFIYNDNTATSLGINNEGQLGNGTTISSLTFNTVLQDIEPISLNIPYFIIIKTMNMLLNKVELSLQQYNVVDGSEKKFKLSSGNKTLDYYITQGTDIVSSIIDITQNGFYAIYLKDDRGFEWKETILINDIVSDTVPILNTVNTEFLIPFISKNATNIGVNYTHQEPTQTTAIELAYNSATYSSVQEVTPEGTNLNKTYNIDLTGVAETNQKLNVLLKLKDQNNFLSTEKSNIIEIYNPNVILKSTINSMEIGWVPSKLTNVEYVLKRDGIEIYRGSTVNFIDESVELNKNYLYTLEVIHNGNTYLVYTGNKLSGNFTFQTLGDIHLEMKEISINSVSQGETLTSNKIEFKQIADIEKEYSIKMKMTPLTSNTGENISSSNFTIKNALLKDDISTTLAIRDFSFIDNNSTVLVSNADTVTNKKLTLEVLPSSLKLTIPKDLKLNELPNDTFTSTITYQVEWSP